MQQKANLGKISHKFEKWGIFWDFCLFSKDFWKKHSSHTGVLPQSSQRRRRGRRDVVSPEWWRWPLTGKSEVLGS